MILGKIFRIIKSVVKKVDSKIFGSRLRKRFLLFKARHGEKFYNFRSFIGRRFVGTKIISKLCVRELSVNDLLLSQYYNEDYSLYKHLDGAVRLLAIKEYYGENDFGFDLYRRMQANSGFDWTNRFSKLIASCEKNSFNPSDLIELDRHFAIMDGSHRVMLAYYHNIEFVKAQIYDCDRDRSFDSDFFWSNGFTLDEISLIKDNNKKILDSLNYEFVGVIWPPAFQLANNIINDINLIEPDNIKVTSFTDYHLEKGDFEHLFKALYHTDILNEQGMENKIKQIHNSLPTETAKYSIRVYYLHIKNPQIGLNEKNYTPQSKIVKRLKKAIRGRYKNRVKNYQYDVIMHISDNYLQSKFCKLLFEINKDISDYFVKIKKYKYVILRAKGSRQHSKFPYNLYFRSNSDILASSRADLNDMANITEEFANNHFSKYEWVSIKRETFKDEIKIQIYLRDFMVYQFELMLHIYGLKDSFRDECFKHCLCDNYKYLPDSDEVIIRIAEYIHKPKKKWYLPYIKSHLKDLYEDRLFKNIDTSQISYDSVEKFLNEIKGGSLS